MLSGSGEAVSQEGVPEVGPEATMAREGLTGVDFSDEGLVSSTAAGLMGDGAWRSSAERVWASGYRGVLARKRRVGDRLSRPHLDPDLFRSMAIERDCLDAFLNGEVGVTELLRRIRTLSLEDQAEFAAGLDRARSLFHAAGERQLTLLPAARHDVPRPRERVLRDEVEASCWAAFREGAEALSARIAGLADSPSRSPETQLRAALERSCLQALFGGSKGVASALRRHRAAAMTGPMARRRSARLAASVLGPMLEVLVTAEGSLAR